MNFDYELLKLAEYDVKDNELKKELTISVDKGEKQFYIPKEHRALKCIDLQPHIKLA